MKNDKFCLSKEALKIGFMIVVGFVAIYFYFSYLNINSPKTKAKEINPSPIKSGMLCYFDGQKVTTTSRPYYFDQNGCVKSIITPTHIPTPTRKPTSTPTPSYICPTQINCTWNPTMDKVTCGCCGYLYDSALKRCIEPAAI